MILMSLMRILLVEDDESIREVFKLMLEADAPFEDLIVDAVSSGREAIEFVTGIKPDIVLLDLSMPNEHGFDVFKELRRLEGRADLTVIAVTAHNARDLEEEAASIGFAGYITKPIDFENSLYPLLKQLMEKRKGQSAAA